MSTSAPSGGPSPLRVGGLALLGAGVVAGLVGLGTLATANGGEDAQNTAAQSASATVDPSTGASPSASVSPSTEPPAAIPPSPTGVPVPSFTPTNGLAAPPPAAPPPPADAPAAGPPAAAPPASVRMPVRVYNNSTIPGLAARAAADFRNAGWPVEEVANYPFGIIPTSTVYYRQGTGEQAAATTLGNEFGMRVEPRFVGLNDASPGLIVIVTNDYQKRG